MVLWDRFVGIVKDVAVGVSIAKEVHVGAVEKERDGYCASMPIMAAAPIPSAGGKASNFDGSHDV